MAYLTCAFTRVRFCKGYQPSQPECASTENGGKFVGVPNPACAPAQPAPQAQSLPSGRLRCHELLLQAILSLATAPNRLGRQLA